MKDSKGEMIAVGDAVTLGDGRTGVLHGDVGGSPSGDNCTVRVGKEIVPACTGSLVKGGAVEPPAEEE